MTNEDILRTMVGDGLPAWYVERVVERARSLVSQAYEQAAQDICWCCRELAHAPERDTDGNWTHVDLTGTHGITCAAGAIHERALALKESLEPVPA